MVREGPRAGVAADELDAIASLRAAVSAMADTAVESAEAAVAVSQAHLATVKSMRAALQNYDHALTVLSRGPTDSR